MTARNWSTFYDENHALYARLVDVATVLMRQQLEVEEIKYLSMSSRVKARSSYLEKVERKGYADPSKQLTDFAGIRVVTYLPSQVSQVCDLVHEFFDIDSKNSDDKSVDLGIDKVGYQSRHFICRLGRRRSKLPEYKGLHALAFEVQVRTILQHAWADLAHSKTYKFSSRLPNELQRRLNLHAGNLELVDIGLDELSSSIDAYSAMLATRPALHAEPVNSISLFTYVKDKFPEAEDRGGSVVLDELVDELRNYGISTIGEFDKIIKDDLYNELLLRGKTVAGIVRITLLCTDFNRYFSRSWKGQWVRVSKDVSEFIQSRSKSKGLLRVLKKNNIAVVA
jgi:ppGpp synthetase/RelA/SpoT-type nucleotidyltranferase